MNVHRQRQRQFIRGDDRALASCPDPLALEVLVGVVAADARRRSRAPWIFTGLFLGSAFAIGVLALLSLGTSYFVIPFLLFLMGLGATVLATSPNDTAPKALQTIRTQRLPRATPEMVPALLDLCHTLGGSLFYDAQSVESQTEAEVHAALATLLPRFHDAASLTAAQRRALESFALWYQRTAPDRTVAALLVLAETGDRGLLGVARRWRRWHPDEKVAAAAAEYLSAVEARP